MRIVFLGTPQFAVPSLQRLILSAHHIAGVVTAPDKPRGRGRKVVPTPVAFVAQEFGLPVLKPEALNSTGFLTVLNQWKADLFLVVAFRILPEAVFNLPPKGSINLHASLLPAYRGAAPIQWALWNGETETGLTTFQIEMTVDTGNILLQRKVEILADDDAGSLAERMADKGADLLLETVDAVEARTLTPRDQDSRLTSPAPKITRDHCAIDWTRRAVEIHNQIRALAPHPGAITKLADKTLKILRSRVLEDRPVAHPGTLNITDADITCDTGDDVLLIEELQLEGKKAMDVDAFLRGYRPRGRFVLSNLGE